MNLACSPFKSEAFRKGMREGRKRIAGIIAGITAGEQSDDELLGLIFVLETVLVQLKAKVYRQRRERSRFKLKLVK